MKFSSKFTALKTLTLTLAGLLSSCSSSTQKQGQRGKITGGARPDAATMFRTRDLNNDGFLSYEEFQARAARTGSATARKRTAPTAEMARKRFATIDANSDQKISLAELKAQPQRRPRKSR